VAGPNARPNFMAVGGWDGMHLIYDVVAKLNGRIDADQAIAAAKGATLQSPRGAIHIDPATRDVIQDVYVRKVERVGGKYYNVEIDKFEQVKDPGKSGP
jgi:branched-chain amino acid transport system substrate-binding protein